MDYHTAGEPFRIVVAGAPDIEGRTILDKRAFVSAHADEVRRVIIDEPRGHADQYGCFVTEPDDSGAAFGVIFFHKDGYSTACGHGTIAVATWAAAEGPATGRGGWEFSCHRRAVGQAARRRHCGGGACDGGFVRERAVFRGGTREIELETSRGPITADIAYGGAYYASIEASSVDLAVRPQSVGNFISLGREMKALLRDHPSTDHSTDQRLSGLYGTIFYEDQGARDGLLHQRNVTIFADGEVDCSPCGSGTSARLALLDDSGELGEGEVLDHESVTGTSFRAPVLEKVLEHDRPAVITEVIGSAFRTGSARFELDPADPLGLGFQLR